MAIEEAEPNSSSPVKASAVPVVEDPKGQDDDSSLKENAEVSNAVDAQTPPQETEEEAKDNQGKHADVAGIENEVEADTEGGGKITKVKAESGAEDTADVELQPPRGEAKDFETEHHVKITAEAKAEAELDSQGDGESEVPAEPQSEADDAGVTEFDNDEEAEKPHKLTVDDMKTAPMDFRFPTTNQAKHCFTRYVEYHKCVQAKGDENSDCNKYARYYRSLCPGEWVDKWNEQRENGSFPGPL